MTTLNPLQSTVSTSTNNQQTIIDDIFKQKPVPLKKHFVSRFTYIQSDIEEAGLQPTECRILASINSLFFGRDVAKTNRSQLARKTTYTKSTISRSMQRLQHRHHLIEYENTGRGYIIRLSDFARSIPKLVKHYGQVGLKKLFQLYCRLKDIFEGNDTEQISGAEISETETFTDPDPKTEPDPDPDQSQVSATSEVRLDHFRSDPGALLTLLYKENITTTDIPPEPPTKPNHKSLPAQHSDLAVADEINNIKKIIEPEILLNRKAIEKLIGIDYDHIRYAKNEAMKPGTKNKKGLFIYLCNEEMPPMEKLKNGLDTVAIPTDIDGYSVEMRKITCYNRNVSNLTCTSIIGTTAVTKDCLQFCPFYVQRMEQDLKSYQKICVEIVRETDKALLVKPVDNPNEQWIPKKDIKKQESYGDDSFLITIPKSYAKKKPYQTIEKRKKAQKRALEVDLNMKGI